MKGDRKRKHAKWYNPSQKDINVGPLAAVPITQETAVIRLEEIGFPPPTIHFFSETHQVHPQMTLTSLKVSCLLSISLLWETSCIVLGCISPGVVFDFKGGEGQSKWSPCRMNAASTCSWSDRPQLPGLQSKVLLSAMLLPAAIFLPVGWGLRWVENLQTRWWK